VTEDDLSTPSRPPARRIAIYPGTFDPVHRGHVDIAHRAARLFDELIVAVYDRPAKALLFAPEERIELARASLGQESDGCRIVVMGYSGLTIHFARAQGAIAIVRGLRVVSDFENEFQMAQINQTLAPDIDVVLFMAGHQYTFFSSSTVREIASLGGDVSWLVPPHVAVALKRVYDQDRQ
jgi:pantetheine-phosphate adenylyltransferase